MPLTLHDLEDLVSCPVNTCHFAGPYRGAGKARARVQAGRLAPWPQRSMRPDTAQPEGFGACGALAGRPHRVKTPSLDPVRAAGDRSRRHTNEMPGICGTGH